MYNGDPHDLLAEVISRHQAVMAVAHKGVRLGYELANRHLANAPHMPGVFRPRARRSLQNDYAVAWARSLLQPLEDEGLLGWVEEAETLTIRLPSGLACRIKKVDLSGQASNADTRRNDSILDAGQSRMFSNGPDVLAALPSDLRWFNIGYVPDVFDASLRFCGLALSGGPILPFATLDDDVLAQIAPTAWSGIVAARQQLA